MSDDVARAISEALKDLAVDVAIIKTKVGESDKLSHESRINGLEKVVATLSESVKALVKTMDDRKESNQHLITTGLAAAAVVVSVYGLIHK